MPVCRVRARGWQLRWPVSISRTTKTARLDRRSPNSMPIRRGDVVAVAASGDYGKPRPAVVVQSDSFPDTHASVIICQMTSSLADAPDFRVTIEPSMGERAAEGVPGLGRHTDDRTARADRQPHRSPPEGRCATSQSDHGVHPGFCRLMCFWLRPCSTQARDQPNVNLVACSNTPLQVMT